MIESESINIQEVQQEPKAEKIPLSPQFEAFLQEYDKLPDLDAKLQKAMEFMEASLSGEGTPHFRSFWEVRRLCLPLFKEAISPALRGQHWTRYIELSKEARRLKDLLDEQSAFAVEQIEIAIQGLENDLASMDQPSEDNSYFNPDLLPRAVKHKATLYSEIQQKLNAYNAHASRINALRKELMKTEMRIRHKNKFFQRLSAAGDKVFPLRKDLIKTISQQFIDDINQFVKANFSDSIDGELLFQLRDEIKTLQSLAKVLTLNTSSFNQTRQCLSECWDKLKTEDKERKKERNQQRAEYKEKGDQVRAKFLAFKEVYDKGEISLGEATKQLDALYSLLIPNELGRDEVQALRQELNELRRPVLTRIHEQDALRQQQEEERQRAKREGVKAFKEKVEKLGREHHKYDAAQLEAQRDQLLAEMSTHEFSRHEKMEIERQFKPLRDLITERKEKALLDLSEDDLNTLQQLREILSQRKERRQEVKSLLEQYRKAAGASGMDFEKAMQFQLQVSEEKERLEKANQGIAEIEEMIDKLESRDSE